MTQSDYLREGGALLKRRHLPELHVTLTFKAEDIRDERTGTHARLHIFANKTVLAYSAMNVDRDEDRVRLANSAHRQLVGGADKKAIYPSEYMKADLDAFCYGLLDAKMEEYAVEFLGGTLVPTPPDLILDPFIIRDGGTIIFAPPGRGKSYTMLLLQLSVDAGLTTFWRVKQARTLFVNLERAKRSVLDRLGNMNAALGLERDRQLPILNARGRSLLDISKLVEQHIARYDAEVVFVDSISRAGSGDLIANDTANRIIDTLNHIAPTWVGLAHTPRSDASHLYGSVHFEAGADVIVQLASEQEEMGPLGIGLVTTKSNDAPKGPMWIGALEFDQNGLTLVRRARPGEFPDVEQMKKMTGKEMVRQHLLDMGALDATQIAEDLGLERSAVAHVLADEKTFVKGGKVGRRQLYAVKA